MANQVADHAAASAWPATGVTVESRLRPEARKRWKGRLIAGVTILLIAGLAALTAPWISPFAPEHQEIATRLQGPSLAHWLGTDNFGRDVLSRLLWGGRVSLAIGLLSMVISVTVGVLVGALSGYFGRSVDTVLMRFTELMLVFPTFFLLILVVTAFGRNILLLILFLGLTSWPVSARIIRGQVLKTRELDYILAARALGATSFRIIAHHVIPNIASVIIVSATIRVGILILVEAGLSFLGLGIQEPMSSWGSMVSSGANYIRSNWWLVAAPGLAIFTSVLGFNLLGEGVRDLLDPRRGRPVRL